MDLRESHKSTRAPRGPAAYSVEMSASSAIIISVLSGQQLSDFRRSYEKVDWLEV